MLQNSYAMPVNAAEIAPPAPAHYTMPQPSAAPAVTQRPGTAQGAAVNGRGGGKGADAFAPDVAVPGAALSEAAAQRNTASEIAAQRANAPGNAVSGPAAQSAAAPGVARRGSHAAGTQEAAAAKRAAGMREDAMPAAPSLAQPNYLLRTQLFVCLFLAAVLYFAWRQGGQLWVQLARFLRQVLEEGISFSGQEELTRFTDEARDFFGRLVEAFATLG